MDQNSTLRLLLKLRQLFASPTVPDWHSIRDALDNSDRKRSFTHRLLPFTYLSMMSRTISSWLKASVCDTFNSIMHLGCSCKVFASDWHEPVPSQYINYQHLAASQWWHKKINHLSWISGYAYVVTMQLMWTMHDTRLLVKARLYKKSV